LHKADTIADRLWREAERVTRLATLNADRESLAAALARADEERLLLLDQARRREAEWNRSWLAIGIEALAPEYMVEWVRRRGEILETIEGRRVRQIENDELREREQTLRRACLVACVELDVEAGEREALSLIVDKLEAAVRQRGEQRLKTDQLREARAQALAEHDQGTRQREQLEQRFTAWRTTWQQRLAELPVASDLEPVVVLDVLERIEQLFSRVEGLRQIEQRIAGIVRDRQKFADDVRQLAQEHYPDAFQGNSERPCGELADAIIQAFRSGTAALAERERVLTDISQNEQALEERTLSREEANRVLEALMRAAKVDDPAKLESIEAKVRRSEQLRQEVEHVEQQLLSLGAGASTVELARETEGVDVDAIPARLEEIQAEIEEVGEEIEARTNEIARLNVGVERLDVGAATAAEDLEAALAQLRDTTHQYLRLQMAVTALEREIENYREQNQGPVVKRAGEIFSRLTLGGYLGLQVGLDDDEKQVLLCKRGDGAKLQVTSLSDGTRDQLYLALRLASLERFAEHREPLPLVLDDILIHFDDERAAAALEVLAEYSTRGQVLFFTHHARLVELAKARLPSPRLIVHELPNSHFRAGTGRELLS
jgi:uncharacterized protein YhaN